MSDACTKLQTVTSEIGRNSKELKNYRMMSTRANDTFQRLNYESRIPFDTLWEPRERVSIPVKPTIRRERLGDLNLEDAIKTRPRVYISPNISLDDVKNPETRKMFVNFTYNTTSRQANKEVWKDFKPRAMCLLLDTKEGFKPPVMRSIHYMPPGMDKVAFKWDRAQERNIIAEEEMRSQDTFCSNTERETKDSESIEEKKIKQLISKNELSIIYDKFPLSYGGFRSREGLGVPLQRMELDFSHPKLPISKALYQYQKYQGRNG